jgi:hypothetical protein
MMKQYTGNSDDMTPAPLTEPPAHCFVSLLTYSIINIMGIVTPLKVDCCVFADSLIPIS